jgi:hypothetical protein
MFRVKTSVIEEMVNKLIKRRFRYVNIFTLHKPLVKTNVCLNIFAQINIVITI